MSDHHPDPARRSLVLGSAAAAATAAGWPALALAQNRPVKIGYVTALSGTRAPFGVADEWHLARMRAFLKDGIAVAGGKRLAVEIIAKDNQSDPNRSLQVVQDLVLRDKVDLMLVQDGDATTPAGQLCDVHGIPMVSTMLPWQAFMFSRNGTPDKGFPFSFHFFWGAEAVVDQFAAMWEGVKTNKQVGTLYIDLPPGHAFADPQRGMPAKLRSSGYKETSAGFFKLATDDFSNQVSAFKAGGTQIVSGFMYENHVATFWKQAGQAGFKPEVVSLASAFLFPSAMKSLGAAGNGMSTEVWWTPNFPFKSSLSGQSAKDLAADWEKSTGNQWTQPLGYAHALWEVAVAALRNAADPRDRKSVRDALRDLTLDTIVGKVDFKHSPIKSVAQTQLAGGQWRRTPDGSRHPFELLVVDNSLARNIPVADALKLMSQLK